MQLATGTTKATGALLCLFKVTIMTFMEDVFQTLTSRGHIKNSTEELLCSIRACSTSRKLLRTYLATARKNSETLRFQRRRGKGAVLLH